ncbi:hypothetical protein D9619_012836 [Psilocybe cf. subviscida]|uniref:Uncharacterized protein n=1 Tax=Psilocybe cf. subviscida TaxID=2480587 RepID=A0A8H5ER30_9AGAR|nr:hypothetical protein D9619_012836 [Psilocybe cf. subviscida]
MAEFSKYLYSTTSGRFFFQLWACLLYVQLPISGIGPTLIAFRVAEETYQTEVGSTSRTSPLSGLKFRRTTPATATDIESQPTRVSTIQFVPAYGVDHASSVRTDSDVEAQHHRLAEKEEMLSLEKLGHSLGTESV